MAYYKTPINYPSGLIREDTAKINENFSELAKAFVDENPITRVVNNAANADKLDGFDSIEFMVFSFIFGT